MFLRVNPDCRPYKQISSGIIDLRNVFRRMDRQGDTLDRLGKMLDDEVIAKTYGKDDGTYRAIAFFWLISFDISFRQLSRGFPCV